LWHDILAILSLEDKFQVTTIGENKVIVQLRGSSTIYSGDPRTRMLWNVNGFASRWTNEVFVDNTNDAPLSAKQNKKRRTYSRKRETADSDQLSSRQDHRI
jgi:hypothetical protein